MKIFRNLISSFLSGKAFMKFNQGKYSEVINILNKAINLDPNSEGIEVSLSCLGRSYLALKKYDDAFNIINKSYELFKNNYNINKNEEYKNEFINLIDSYIFLLEKKNLNDKVQEIKERKYSLINKECQR